MLEFAKRLSKSLGIQLLAITAFALVLGTVTYLRVINQPYNPMEASFENWLSAVGFIGVMWGAAGLPVLVVSSLGHALLTRK